MVEIQLYQPGITDAAIIFPQQWNELTTEELEIVSKNVLTDYPDADTAKANLFASILQLRAEKKVRHIARKLDGEDAVLNGYPLIEFIFTGNQLTQQPYPQLRVPNRMVPCKPFIMAGLANSFDNITCGEFEDAEIFYYQFKEDPDPKYLVQLAAALYRPAGVPYLSFNADKNDWIAYDAERMYPHFKKVQPWRLYTIFLWYCGCRGTLPELFPSCFGGGSSGGESDFLTFTKCIHSGAGPKNGSRTDIRRTPLKEFFMDIQLENEKAQEQLEQLKNGR